MDEKDKEMMVLLLALCRLTGVKTDTVAIQNALKKARLEADLFEKGQYPYGHSR